MTDIWARVDEAIDTDPLQLRDIVAEVLRRAEYAEGQLSSLRDHRTRWETEHAEAERLRAELAEANEAYLATVKAAHEGGAALQRRAERAEARCELTEEATNRWYAAHEQAAAERDALRAAVKTAREAFDGTTPGAGGNSKLDALLQRAAAGQLLFTDDAQNLGRIVTELLNRLARIQAALDGGA